MATTPEGRIKRKVDQLLHELDVWYYSPQAGPFGSAGIPDRVAIVCGQFLGIECKADAKKKPTALQVKCMRDIEVAGGRCFVVCDEQTLLAVRTYIQGVKEQHSVSNQAGSGPSHEVEQPG